MTQGVTSLNNLCSIVRELQSIAQSDTSQSSFSIMRELQPRTLGVKEPEL